MNDIQLFLTVKIKNTGILAAIGNFFLTPARYFFFGKSIAVMDDQGIAEVPSFYYGETIKARRDSTLQSTDSDIGYAQPIVYWMGFTLAVIPGIILGSIFKGLSYIKNPLTQRTHNLVKEKLTPIIKEIELSEDDRSVDSKLIEERLQNYSLTGQHTSALIISNKQKEAKNITLNDNCIKEIIRHISPYKLILNKKIKANEDSWRNCINNWDLRALKFFIPTPKRVGDYTGQGGADNIFSRPQEEINKSIFSFLKPQRNAIPGVMRSVKKALNENSDSRKVYVIK